MNEIDWCTEEFSKIDLGDKRLDSRVIRLAARFSELSESPINQSCDGLAEIKAAYRFFDNERILPEKILFPHQKKTVERAQKLKTILAIQDTCFLNYTLHRKTTGLGKISSSVLNNGLRRPNYGLIMHTTFGVSTEGVPLGILDQSIWSRDVERKTSFDETTVPIEEKESFKWLESLRKVKRLFSKATTQVVTVCDREADIYEFFADASKQKMPVLIRASFDRSINKKNRRSKPEDKLWGFIKSKSCAGVLKVEVAKKKGEPARVALLEVRFSPFILNPPTSRTANKDGLLPNIDCHAIYVSEVNPPQDATPLEWMLISSIPINNFEEATEKITWYCYRWRIENFHKILKSGYHIEACRLQAEFKNEVQLLE